VRDRLCCSIAEAYRKSRFLTPLGMTSLCNIGMKAVENRLLATK
jgi:hypothetical protein